jgi:dihydroflavonol-4-reductase
MNVLITGGTGFIGSRLALKCLETGISVSILGQENTAAEADNRRLVQRRGAQVILASVTDRARVFESLQGIDLVYHLAAAQHEANVPDQRFWDVNVHGTQNILEACLNAKVKRLVHGSTIGVYGSALEGEIDEQSSLKPDHIYGITKLEGEKVVRSFQDQLPAVVIRISETYGPGDRRLLKLFRAIKKHLFWMIGDGTNLHHLIYIDDLIEGLLLASTVPAAVGKTFVLSGTAPLTTNDMVEIIAKQLRVRRSNLRLPLAPLLILATATEKTLRPMGIQPPLHRRRMDFFQKSFVFSQEQSERVLGFIPHTTFQQGVAETAKWYSDMGYL